VNALLWTAGLGAGAGVLGAVAALLHATARPVWEIERYARDVADSAGALRANLEVADELGRLGEASAEVRRRVGPATAPTAPTPVPPGADPAAAGGPR
jgi:hypothetical protein